MLDKEIGAASNELGNGKTTAITVSCAVILSTIKSDTVDILVTKCKAITNVKTQQNYRPATVK